MSNMHGNPHVEAAKRLSGDGRIAEATLALAYEQRTANLIALYADGSNGPAPEVDYHTLIKQIVARLHPEGK